MSTCDVAYVKSDYERASSKKARTTQGERKLNFIGQLLNRTRVNKYDSLIHKPKGSGVTLISSYIPTSRTFVIAPLESNHPYVFQMACEDNNGYQSISKVLDFKTGK